MNMLKKTQVLPFSPIVSSISEILTKKYNSRYVSLLAKFYWRKQCYFREKVTNLVLHSILFRMLNSSKSTTPQPTPTKHPTGLNVEHSPPQDFRKPWLTYAKASSQKSLISPSQRRSSSNMTNGSSSVDGPNPVPSTTKTLLRGASEFSVVYDVSGKKVFPPTFYKAMGQLIPNGKARGLKTHLDKNRSLIEFMVKDEETCDILVQNPVEIENITLKAVRTLPKDAEIVTLKLRNLPFDEVSELENGLKLTLGIYGKVLEVSLHHEIHGGFFLGTGVATMDIAAPITISPEASSDQTEKGYKPLEYAVPYKDSRFFMEWNRMPLTCRYCCVEGHGIGKCPSKTEIQCWYCEEFDHVSYKCPLKNSRNQRKKPKPQPTPTKTTANKNKNRQALNKESNPIIFENEKVNIYDLTVSDPTASNDLLESDTIQIDLEEDLCDTEMLSDENQEDVPQEEVTLEKSLQAPPAMTKTITAKAHDKSLPLQGQRKTQIASKIAKKRTLIAQAKLNKSKATIKNKAGGPIRKSTRTTAGQRSKTFYADEQHSSTLDKHSKQ
jgi:hypothetical protein